MTDDAKRFMFGLEQCREAKGMVWHGKMPQEIVELFELSPDQSKGQITIAVVYVELRPQRAYS